RRPLPAVHRQCPCSQGDCDPTRNGSGLGDNEGTCPIHTPQPMTVRSRRLVFASIFALSALLGSAGAQAFGPDGHRIVAALAERQLTPPTRAAVHQLLGAEAAEGLAGLANWADDIRDEQAWRHTSRWHYVNFPRASCRYDAARDCPDGRCIVAALRVQAQRLGDRTLTRHERV